MKLNITVKPKFESKKTQLYVRDLPVGTAYRPAATLLSVGQPDWRVCLKCEYGVILILDDGERRSAAITNTVGTIGAPDYPVYEVIGTLTGIEVQAPEQPMPLTHCPTCT